MSWREEWADQLAQLGAELGRTLAELENAHAILETFGRADACSELRGTAALLRSEQAGFIAQARDLRAEPARVVFPIAATTRGRIQK